VSVGDLGGSWGESAVRDDDSARAFVERERRHNRLDRSLARPAKAAVTAWLAAMLNLNRDPRAVATRNHIGSVIAFSTNMFGLVPEPLEQLLYERLELPPVQAVNVVNGGGITGNHSARMIGSLAYLLESMIHLFGADATGRR
jgi:hypothetical protein